MTLPTLDELEGKERHRKNDDLILYKLDQLAENDQRLHDKIDSHIESTSHAIHGNGTPGIKSQLEVVKSRVALISLLLVGAWSAIIASFIKLKGG